MVIEPIYEADFEESSYGFRPKRSSSDAMVAIKRNLQEGNTEVYEADLSSYFDTIPHEKLLKTIGKRISDSNVIHLIKMWLKAPVIEDGRPSGGKKNKIGTPQGGVISPLLSNIYLNLLDRIVNRLGGIFYRYGVKIIRYADDFILMGKKIPEEIEKKLREILDRVGLRINEEKSRLVKAEKSSFEFLGFTIRYDKDLYGSNKRYWNIIPSEKSCKKIRENIRECLKKTGHLSAEILVKVLNPKIRGWINYFTINGVSYPAMSKRKLRWYLCERLYRYYKRKSQRHNKSYSERTFDRLVNKYGMIDPTKYCKMTPVKG
jgi:group II intron reverse transcriptase/maturase